MGLVSSNILANFGTSPISAKYYLLLQTLTLTLNCVKLKVLQFNYYIMFKHVTHNITKIGTCIMYMSKRQQTTPG